MIKFLHTGDFHLDSPFLGLNGDEAIERRRDRRRLLRRIVELGNSEGVSLLLLAGDLFDGKNAYYETAKEIADALNDSRARVFIAPGNHDAFTHDSPYRSVRFPQNVHIFKSREIERVDIPELGLTVYGAGFDGENCDASLLSGFRAEESGISVMLMHGNLAGADYNPIKESEIAESRLTYLALGHIHAASGLKTAGKTFYAYPGCPEGRGFDETGDKGVLLGELSAAGVKAEFRTVSEYRYMERSVDLTGVTDTVGAIREILPEDTAKETCRLTLTGRCDAPDLGLLESSLKDRFYKLIIRDGTQPAKNVWDGMDGDDLAGLFLQSLYREYNGTDNENEREKLLLAAKFGMAAFENRDIN